MISKWLTEEINKYKYNTYTSIKNIIMMFVKWPNSKNHMPVCDLIFLTLPRGLQKSLLKTSAHRGSSVRL